MMEYENNFNDQIHRPMWEILFQLVIRFQAKFLNIFSKFNEHNETERPLTVHSKLRKAAASLNAISSTSWPSFVILLLIRQVELSDQTHHMHSPGKHHVACFDCCYFSKSGLTVMPFRDVYVCCSFVCMAARFLTMYEHGSLLTLCTSMDPQLFNVLCRSSSITYFTRRILLSHLVCEMESICR